MKKQKRSGERLALHVSAVSIVWNVVLSAFKPVSYTHLDVYKRQVLEWI